MNGYKIRLQSKHEQFLCITLYLINTQIKPIYNIHNINMIYYNNLTQ